MGFISSYGCLGSFSLCAIFQAIDKEGLSEAFNAIDNAIRIDKIMLEHMLQKQSCIL